MTLVSPHLPMDLTIIGLGGCGKTLLHKISEHDWFIKQYLSDLDSRLGLYTIDTAMNEHEDDLHAMFHVRERINKIRSQEHENSVITGVINCNHFNLSEMANIQEIPDMTGHDVVDRLHLADENKVWWLHDPEHGINFSELAKLNPRLKSGFKGGVYRMRAVSKAAFTIAYQAHQGQFVDLINNVRGTTAIIVGLGGGTGSGMFIDLAKKIREHKPDKEICLFAILPSSCEGQDEQLNAAVALTELEYLNVANPPEGKIFDHVILTSLEPTEFRCIEESRDSQDILDFDDAFPYLFTNTFANRDCGMGLNYALNYGGFTHAVAHVIECPIERLNSLVYSYDSYLDKFTEVTAIHRNICDDVANFFEKKRNTYCSEYGLEITSQSVDLDDTSRYREDINKIKTLWESENARYLQLQTPKIIEEIVTTYLSDDNLGHLSFDGLKNYVSTIKVQMNAFQSTVMNGNKLDTKLFNCIYDNLCILETIGEFYILTTCLKENTLRKSYMAIMSLDPNAEEYSSLIKTQINELYNYTMDKMSLVQIHETRIDDINKNLDNLVRQIKEIKEYPADKDRGIKMHNTMITAINTEMSTTKHSIKMHISEILDFIQMYCYQKQKQPEVFDNQSSAEIHRIISLLDMRIDVEWMSDKLIDAIKHCKPEPNEMVETLVNTIFDNLDELNGWSNRLNEHMSAVMDRTDNLIQNNHNNMQKEREKLEISIYELDELERCVELNISKVEHLISVNQELLIETRDKRFKYKQLIKWLREPNVFEAMSADEHRHYKSIVGTINPAFSTLDILSATEIGDIDIAKFISDLNHQSLELLSNVSIGMNALTISSTNDITRAWYPDASALTISSQSHLLGERINDVDPNIGTSFLKIMMNRIDWAMRCMQNCCLALHNGAKPRECGISLMATGNYLENILGFQRGGCYRMAYENSKDNILHHVLGLENGEYLTRDLLSPDQAMELAYAENFNPSDEQSMYAIMSLHHTKRIVDALPEAE